MMQTKTSIMRALLKEGIVVSPGVYDGLSARMVQKMGFKAAATGGSGFSNARLGQPDIGLLTLMENVEFAGGHPRRGLPDGVRAGGFHLGGTLRLVFLAGQFEYAHRAPHRDAAKR